MVVATSSLVIGYRTMSNSEEETITKRYLLECEIDTNACLSDIEGDVEVVRQSIDGSYEIYFRNLSVDPGANPPLLLCRIVVTAESIDQAKATAEDKLKEYLHVLSFVTSMRFKIHRYKKLIDWTAGEFEREAKWYAEVPNHDLPYEMLEEENFDAALTIDKAELSELDRRLLRLYSNALNATHLDDKYQFFFFVIETIAEASKGSEEVPDKCQVCNSPLYCEDCKDYSTHRPFGKDVIKALLERTIDGNTDDTIKTINNVRHRIAHGSHIEAIEKKYRVKFSELVNMIGNVAWTCLLNVIGPKYAKIETENQIGFLRPNRYTDLKMTMVTDMTVGIQNHEAPDITKVPDIKVTPTLARKPKNEEPDAKQK